MKISIGDRVKVIDQEGIGYEITGTVVEDWGKTVVIIDDDAETLDDRLEVRISGLEEEVSDGDKLTDGDFAQLEELKEHVEEGC
jgi:predicted nuclease with TOPRIM domain